MDSTQHERRRFLEDCDSSDRSFRTDLLERLPDCSRFNSVERVILLVLRNGDTGVVNVVYLIGWVRVQVALIDDVLRIQLPPVVPHVTQSLWHNIVAIP